MLISSYYIGWTAHPTLATVSNHTTGSIDATHTKLTDTTGFLGSVSGIGVLRFNFAGQENGCVGCREFIAPGTASNPDLT